MEEIKAMNITESCTSPDAACSATQNPWNATGNVEEGDLYDVTVGILVLLSILYGSISLVTVIGNVLVILVVCKNKGMQTVTNFFIANLSVADVMIGIFSTPFQFQAALLQRWDLPAFLCLVAPFVKELTVNVSIVTLTVISIDRYFAILHPLRPRCSRRVAAGVMILVWTFSLISAIPSVIVYRVEDVPDGDGGWNSSLTKPFCYPEFPTASNVDLGKVYRLYLVIIQYFFPLAIISYAYFRIMFKIWYARAPGCAVDSRDQIQNRNKRKVKMLTGFYGKNGTLRPTSLQTKRNLY